jgi:hypothetical protein
MKQLDVILKYFETKDTTFYLNQSQNIVYIYWCEDTPIYIGQSVSILAHRVEKNRYKEATHITTHQVKNYREALLLERLLIVKLKPRYNKPFARYGRKYDLRMTEKIMEGFDTMG